MTTPGEKLESWRFVVAETDTDEKRLPGLIGWMREVEDQLDALREDQLAKADPPQVARHHLLRDLR